MKPVGCCHWYASRQVKTNEDTQQATRNNMKKKEQTSLLFSSRSSASHTQANPDTSSTAATAITKMRNKNGSKTQHQLLLLLPAVTD